MLELLIAFIVGGAFGAFAMAILAAAGQDDERNGRK